MLSNQALALIAQVFHDEKIGGPFVTARVVVEIQDWVAAQIAALKAEG